MVVKKPNQENRLNIGKMPNLENQGRGDNMLTIDLSAILAFLSILAIAAGAITFMVRLWNKVENSLIKNTIALDGLVEEVGALKQYGIRIQKLEDTTATKDELNLIKEDHVTRKEFNDVKDKVTTIHAQHKTNHKGD